MQTMGRYCKAYYVRDFRKFPGWVENLTNLRPAEEDETGRANNQLSEDDILYLQENFAVTDGIFLEEYVIFDNITDEWKAYCAGVLQFSVPEDGEEVGVTDAATATQT